VVFLQEDGDGSPIPGAWRKSLADLGFELLEAKSPRQVVYYAGNFSLAVILVEIGGPIFEIAPRIREILHSCPAPIPVIAVCGDAIASEDQEALAKAGVRLLVSPATRAEWLADLVKSMSGAAGMSAAGDVAGMRTETRNILHDISQPLAAIQGRLEVLRAKAPPGDPNAATYAKLAELSSQAIELFNKLRELYRKGS
jgi:signal transduction histidine kinase